MFDPRLQTKVINIVDVSYGFENGLNQAIEKSAEALLNVKFMKEKALVSEFFDHIALGDNMVIYGIQDTIMSSPLLIHLFSLTTIRESLM